MRTLEGAILTPVSVATLVAVFVPAPAAVNQCFAAARSWGRRAMSSSFQTPRWRKAPGVLLSLSMSLAACAPRASEPPPEAALDLVDAFSLAEVELETRDIDIGTPEAWPRLGEGWGEDDVMGGLTFAWGLGRRSELRLEIMGPRSLDLVVRCWPLAFEGAPRQTVRVLLNGAEVGSFELRNEWEAQDFRLSLPSKAQVQGENLVAFEYAYSRRPTEVMPGSTDERDLAVAFDALALVGAGGAGEPSADRTPAKPVLTLPLGTSVDYYLRATSGARLVVEEITRIAGTDGSAGPGDGAELLLTVTAAGGAGSSSQHRLDALGRTAGRRTVDLADSEDPVRVRIEARAGGRAPRFGALDGFRLVGPEILGADVRGGRSRGESGSRADPENPPNVLIYLIDTLRADHLGAYGYERPTSPSIDAFARDATLFRGMTAQSSWTRPAVASILTGLGPRSHGVNTRDDGLAPSWPVLPQILSTIGYETAGIVANPNVFAKFGFDRGYDLYEATSGLEDEAIVITPSTEVHELALNWLDLRRDDKPFFLYLHTVDPHEPYDPPEAQADLLAPDVEQRTVGSLESLQALKRGDIAPTPHLAVDLSELYDAEIAFNDHSFGALIDALTERGLYESTLIVLVSDHGEEFFDHGYWTHGATLFEEQLRVPLIVRLPGRAGVGGRVVAPDVVARHVDILPTVLDYLGQAVPEDLEGRSLLPFIASELVPPGAPMASFALLDLDGFKYESVTEGRWKAIANLGPRSGDTRVFDLAEDPGETRDLAQHDPVRAGYLRSVLRRHRLAQRTSAGGLQVEADDELRRTLEALGYVQ